MKRDRLKEMFSEFELAKTFERTIRGGGTTTGTETTYTTYGGDGKATGSDGDCEADNEL